jgi:TetR/AcrR family transcriptional regulator, repressor of fatR-cypB operon
METILSRRDRERLVRRQAMMQAAEAVFAEKGYAQATLDEIAHRAEFGKGTLYNYFEGGKEEILMAIFEEILGDFVDLINEAFSTEKSDRPFREVFQDFIEACLRFFDSRKDQFMLLVKEGHRLVFGDEREKAAYFQSQQERLVHALAPHLDEAMRAGRLRSFPPHAVAHMILGNIKGYQIHVCMEAGENGCHDLPEDAPRHAAAFITTMLLDGLLGDVE